MCGSVLTTRFSLQSSFLGWYPGVRNASQVPSDQLTCSTSYFENSLNLGSAVSAKGFGNTPICTKQHLISVQWFPRISHGRTTCKLWRGDNFILISYYGRTWTIRKELLTFDLFCRLFLYYFLCRNLVVCRNHISLTRLLPFMHPH